MRALLAAPLCAVAAALLALAADTPCAGPALGLLLDPSDAVLLPSEPADEAGLRPLVRLEADWARIEVERGAYDWSAHDAAIERLAGAGFEVGLALGGRNPLYLAAGQVPSPLVAGSLEGWLAFVRGAVHRFHGRVLTFEIGDDPRGAGFDADTFALVLKHSALAVRAEASALGARVLVATAATPAGDLEWLGALWERDVAAYVDVLPVAVGAAAGPAAAADATRAVLEQSLLHPPAASVWTYVAGASDWDAPAAAVSALAAGAQVAAFEPLAEQVPWTLGLQELLGGGYAPAPPGRLRLHYSAGAAPERARVLGSFFHARDFRTLAVFEAPPAADAEAEAHLIVDSRTVRNARIVDPSSGIVLRAKVDDAPDATGDRALRVRPAAGLQAAIFEKQAVNPGFELPREQLEIGAVRSLTAEEIISRHQQVQREQDDRLERWTAKGRIDFHFKLAQGGSTVDVSIDSNYFWERGGELEWEQVQYYVNGNKVTWKKIPELPLIQPEKVVTLPLDLTLNRTYAYRLVGEDKVGERPAYVLEFQPVDPDSALSFYRGRIWIDKSEFVRLKVSLIQNNLEPPVLSNEEVDRFRELTADGQRFWMFDDIDGQQIWNAAGRSFVVRREVSFLEYQINPAPEEFASRRAQAYASEHQMLRDTESGFRYLERQADGSRTVREGVDTSQLFGAAGAFKDSSQDSVLPLAGVNYFDYDLGGKNVQLNVLFAGLFAVVTASKPDLFGGAIDLTADASLSGFKADDRVYAGDLEIEAERIERRSQSLALRLGVPAGQFFKVTVIGRAGLNQYFSAAETSPAFVLPEDHVELAGEVECAWNRRGYSLSLSGRRARRSDWEAWGLSGVPSEPLEDSYTRFGAAAYKEWYLPRFQKIRGSLDYLDGSALDRFSRYQFSFFGEDRLSGFSGSGVRFDRGAIARAGYSFNLFEAIRFDAQLETARVEEQDLPRQSFSGVGLTANFVAPWKTVVNLSWGLALDSDIHDLEGQQEFLLLVFKLF